MLIAQINGLNITVADCSALYPNTSFPSSGPSAEWMAENNCMPVNLWLPYDQNTEKLVPADPYIQGEYVYTVVVEPLTPEEIEQRNQQARAANKAQAASLLTATDWTTIPDVSDPTLSDPYLTNAAEFAAYRSQIRKIAVNPPVTVDIWAVAPDEAWAYTDA
jgi:hypothetical protein